VAGGKGDGGRRRGWRTAAGVVAGEADGCGSGGRRREWWPLAAWEVAGDAR